MPSKKLTKLIDQINAAVESSDEFRLDPEASDIKYYMTEDLRRLNDLSPEGDDLKELIEQASTKYSEREIIDLLVESSEVQLHGIYNVENSIKSWIIGECEEQLDDRLAEKIKKLKPKEFEELRKSIDAYMPENFSGCIYTNHDYDVFWLVVDLDLFTSNLEKIKKLTVIHGERCLPARPIGKLRVIIGGAA